MSGFKVALAGAFALPALVAAVLAVSAIRADRLTLIAGAAMLVVVAASVLLDARAVGPLRPLLNASALFPLGVGVLFLTRRVMTLATGAVPLFLLVAGLLLLPVGLVLALGYLVQGHA